MIREDFIDEDIIAIVPDNAPLTSELFIENFLKSGVTPKIIAQVSSLESMLIMIAANKGVSIMPSCLAAALPELVCIPMHGEHEYINLVAAWEKGKENPFVSEYVSSLISFLQAQGQSSN